MHQQLSKNREVYERAQDFISKVNRSNYIEGQVSKLKAAKEKTYRDFAKFMIKYSKGFTELKTKPEDAIVCYHNDRESFEKIGSIDKELYERILSSSRLSKIPIMVLTKETENKFFVPIVSKKSKLENDCKKSCTKLDGIISDMEKLRHKSRKINIDLGEGTTLLTQIDAERKRMRGEYEFMMTNLEGAKEMRSALKERCIEMRSNLQPSIQYLSRAGLSFDFIKRLTPDQIEAMSKTKPGVNDYFNYDVVQLIEESKSADNLDKAIAHLSTESNSLDSELKRFEDASDELRQIVKS
jgi:hypothetical protein